MSDLRKLEESGKDIEAKLVKIRESLNAPIGDYQTHSAGIEISGKELQEIASKSSGEPIFINEQLSVVYIRDNTYQGYKRAYELDIELHPAGCFLSGNRVHFYICETLEEMKEKKRMLRYQVESAFLNKHIIDIKKGVALLVRLPLCKYCLNIFISRAEGNALPSEHISHIAEYGDTEKLMKHVRSLYHDKPSAKENAREFIDTYKHV